MMRHYDQMKNILLNIGKVKTSETTHIPRAIKVEKNIFSISILTRRNIRSIINPLGEKGEWFYMKKKKNPAENAGIKSGGFRQ